MRAFLSGLTALFLSSFAGLAVAADRPVVVVELFTSQGCSSCPPADEFLGELAHQKDVLPLAMHVDYWDYIGWKDTFARPEHTKRQKAYAYGFGTKSIYTPQMVIGGVDQAVGSHVMKVMEILHRHQMAVGRVSLSTHDGADGRIVRATNISNVPLPDVVIAQIVHFAPKATVAVKRGENAGRSITSTNIVTNIQAFGKWNGKGEIEFTLPNPVAPEGQSAAILLQATRMGDYPGEIVAAIALD
ncbi:hypothetical protein SAMN04488030_0645 [Aliiroseovarius halocynthiae]|uniref:DUF1223 domain-containing protein n=1 Tax=Aliiroseovarius halocynthiae TaxID=985055 RepID=A0A545SUJ3_9RHOB|nr:DUF1223 domain-containing protein [Aliiroseovarius halocynthiae]TQV68612.1 DUF1223 domain-containing protein [Aliiroseovarius halocynthiae]SMR71025.1 hypothetical protein SAMN04488030_0645 [Aliiroseovarius halocynthiae]